MNLEHKLIQDLRNNEQVLQIIEAVQLNAEWESMKGVAETAANFTAPAMDVAQARKIIQDFGIKAQKVVMKSYRGKEYIIFKGYAGQRTFLRGTRYLAENPKVVRMAIGPKGVMSSVKVGFAVTVVLSVGIEILDYVLRDEATLYELLGNVTSDLIKIGISTLAGAIAGLAVGSAAVVGTVAAAPLIAAIAVGVATGIALDAIDSRLGATKALINAYKQIGIDLKNLQWQINRELIRIERNPRLLECLFAPCGGYYY